MNRLSLIVLALLFLSTLGFRNSEGTKYASSTGNITFFSHTDIEDIEAVNHTVKTAFLSNTGKMQFVVLIKDFTFEKALMQEHFNENYMESTKYPKSTFDGTIKDVSSIDFNKDGTYKSEVSGKLTIKDVTKEISTTGTFVVKGNTVNANAVFHVNPEDYNIEIPKVVSNKISRDIKVTVDVDYKKSE